MSHKGESMIGKWIEVHDANGVKYGILREVRKDGIVVAIPTSHGVSTENLDVSHADRPNRLQVEQTQFFSPFFNPFFFRPFAFRPFLFRPFFFRPFSPFFF